MSYDLIRSTPRVFVKTWPHGEEGPTLTLGGVEIPFPDFAFLTEYVLTNTDLVGKDDPRLKLLARLKATTIGPGHNNGGRRIYIPSEEEIV